MDNKMEVFKNEEFGEVRTVMIDNEPWFVGKDVANALQYKDTSDALKRHVDTEDKLSRCFTDSGQNRQMYIINESGLYSLILSSKLPSAKKFKHWITSEVLPSIRKHGMYMTDNLLDAVIQNPEIMQQAVARICAERAEKQNQLAAIQGQLQDALPKAVYYDKFVDPGYATNFRDTAKEFGIGQKCFINLLLQYKFIFRDQKGDLRPEGRAVEKGLFIMRDYTSMTSGHVGSYTLITTKGKKLIYEYFVKKGLL